MDEKPSQPEVDERLQTDSNEAPFQPVREAEKDDGQPDDAAKPGAPAETKEAESEFEITQDDQGGAFGEDDSDPPADDGTPEISSDPDGETFSDASPGGESEGEGDDATPDDIAANEDGEDGISADNASGEAGLVFDISADNDRNDGSISAVETSNEGELVFDISADEGDDDTFTFEDNNEPSDAPIEDGSDDASPEVEQEDHSEGFEDDDVVVPPDDETPSEPGPAEAPDDGSAGADAGDGDFEPIDFSTEKDPPKDDENEKPEEKPDEKASEKTEDEDGGKLAAFLVEPDRDPDPIDRFTLRLDDVEDDRLKDDEDDEDDDIF